MSRPPILFPTPALWPRQAIPLGLLACGLLLSSCSGNLKLPGLQAEKPEEKTRISDAASTPPLQPSRNVIVDAVDKVGPAVVRIDTVKRTVNPLGGLCSAGDPPFSSSRARDRASSPAPTACCSPMPTWWRAPQR